MSWIIQKDKNETNKYNETLIGKTLEYGDN